MASVVRRSRRIGIRGIVVGRGDARAGCGGAAPARLPRRSPSPAAVVPGCRFFWPRRSVPRGLQVEERYPSYSAPVPEEPAWSDRFLPVGSEIAREWDLLARPGLWVSNVERPRT